ncbi:OLC1v1010520C3 [Oldenlandia corymbosa var. corymbosa]|nr:OLC1v1010520C3 [Oldenlandia corymbosa var. corymbosa]
MYAFSSLYDWTEQAPYSTEAPIRKLISEDLSERQNTKHNAPSVIARLMGVDMLPSERKTVALKVDSKNEMHLQNLSNDKSKDGITGHNHCYSKFSKLKRSNSFDSIETRHVDRWNDDTKWDKPRPREHPQEEELQKFKKEFEAWQVARIKECSKFIEVGRKPSQWLAQENLNKEKINFYANSIEARVDTKSVEPVGDGLTSHENGSFQHMEKKSFSSEKRDFYSRIRTTSVDFKLPRESDSGNESDRASEPSKIVILRPGLDTFVNGEEESWGSSPCISEERGSIEDFLEEVKERLKGELHGKTYKWSSNVRGGGIETPYSEKPSDPKQIAQRIAKQVRDSVTRDLVMDLYRSESTRSYRSGMQLNDSDSPEFISRDTRKILAERLRNVLKEESHRHVPDVTTRRSTRLSKLNPERHREEQLRHGSNAGNKLCKRNAGELDMQSRSFRGEPTAKAEIHEDLSPRNLIRSLSAPVSGTSFGKLLLEDRHILTGAHIRRKHESIEKITINVKKRKKEKFSLREKVTSLKYSFTFKGRLFGRKIHISDQQHSNREDHDRNFSGRPTLMMSDYDRPENFTEVPPSPASVCSSIHEEIWRPAEYSSAASMSDVTSYEDSMMPNVFKEISSNLKELRRQLNQLEIDGSEVVTNDDQPMETDMVDIEDPDEAYIRDLLLISGFYDGSCDKSLAKWEPAGKPVSDQVFEEAEESHKQKYIKDDDEGLSKDQNEKSHHKILFDLLNEALPDVLGSPKAMSKFMRKALDPVGRPLRGRKLLDKVWNIIGVYLQPTMDESDYSLDMMIARDLQSSPWSKCVDDDINALGKDVECQIFGDLIDEMVMDYNLDKCMH